MTRNRKGPAKDRAPDDAATTQHVEQRVAPARRKRASGNGTVSARFVWQLAIGCSGLSPHQRLVCLILANHMNRNAIANRFSQAGLIEETGLSRSTIRREIGELNRLGWLTYEPGGGRGSCSTYTATMPAKWRPSEAMDARLDAIEKGPSSEPPSPDIDDEKGSSDEEKGSTVIKKGFTAVPVSDTGRSTWDVDQGRNRFAALAKSASDGERDYHKDQQPRKSEEQSYAEAEATLTRMYGAERARSFVSSIRSVGIPSQDVVDEGRRFLGAEDGS